MLYYNEGSTNMNLIWGVIFNSVTLKFWIGETIIALSSKVAVKIRITESDVDLAFFAYMRGGAI